MKNFRRRNGRSEMNRKNDGRGVKGRSLRAEALERRELMAGEVAAALHHNSWFGKDVNNDLRVTPLDALMVINELNRGGARGLAGETAIPSKFIDVNGDNQLSPIDALQVINSLNRGSGEDVPIIEMMLGMTNDAGQSLVNQATRSVNLSLNQIVNLEVLYTDQRSGFVAPPAGLFSIYTDVLINQTGIFEPLVTEAQVLSLTENLVDARSGFVTLTQDGSTQSAQIQLNDLGIDIAAAYRNAIISTFGYTEAQIETSLISRTPRQGNPPQPGDPFDVLVRFIGDEFLRVDVPDFRVNATTLVTSTGVPVVGSEKSTPPILPDGKFNPEAFIYNYDPMSRTAGKRVYSLVTQNARFIDDRTTNPDRNPNDNFNPYENLPANFIVGFQNVGGVADSGGDDLRDIYPSWNPQVPFEAFSLRMRVVQPTEGAQLQIFVPLLKPTPGEPDETAIDLYGFRPDGSDGTDRGLAPAELTLDQDSRLTVVVRAKLTAVGDPLSTDEDVAGSVNVLNNDINNGNPPLTIIGKTDGANGTVTFSGGVMTYTPRKDYFGPDQFTYTVRNADGDQAIGTVTVNVRSVNDPPTTSNFSISQTEGTQRVIPNSDFISRSSAGPANENQTPVLVRVETVGIRGSAVLNPDGSVTYTAPSGYEGPDSFVFVISDSMAEVKGTVSVTVLDKNDPPVANGGTVTVTEDVPVTFTEQQILTQVLTNDVPGPPNEVAAGQTVSIVSVDAVGSAGGTWVANPNDTYTYTPPQNVFGVAAETFKYRITDGELFADGTITVNITAVNDPPVANPDPNLTVDELTTGNMLVVLANDSAGPNEDSSQTIRIARIVTPTSSGQLSINADKTMLVYTPNDGFVGEDTFTYTITDGSIESAPAQGTITVVPVLRPRAINDPYTVLEDSGVTLLPVTTNDRPNTGFTVTLQTVAAIPASQGTVAVEGNQIRFRPADDFFGSVEFTYTISDTSNPVIDDPDEIAAARGTVTVTVSAVNDPPIFNPDPLQNAVEDIELKIVGGPLLGNDQAGPENESGQTLVITAVSPTSAQGGTVRLVGQDFFYLGRQDYNSNMVPQDSFTYTISDGAGGTVTGTVSLSVAPVNDPPVLNLASGLTAQEDETTPLSFASILTPNSKPGPATATDEVTQTLTIVSAGVAGKSDRGGTLTVNGNQVSYLGAQDFFGTDTFPVTVRDSEGATTTATLTITVNNVNDPPVLGNLNLLAFSKSVATYTGPQLLAGSSVGPGEAGVPGQVLSVVSLVPIAGQTKGQVSFNPTTQTATYTPLVDYVGPDVLRITISDGVTTTTGTVNIDVREFEPSTVRGSVFFDYIASFTNPVRDGLKAAHEPGLQMVQVHLRSAANENVTGAAINHVLLTTVDGGYEFTNVPPGRYRVSFDLPMLVVDGPDFRNGVLDASDTVENQITINIPEPGGFTFEKTNFTVLGYNGRAGNALDLLVSSYMNANPALAQDSQNGGLGAKAYVAANGQGKWFTARGGFTGIRFGELNLDSSGTVVSLSVVMEDGTVKTGVVPNNRRVIMADGNSGFVVQIFGGLSSFGLGPDDSIDDEELGLMMYQSAVDTILAQKSSVI